MNESCTAGDIPLLDADETEKLDSLHLSTSLSIRIYGLA